MGILNGEITTFVIATATVAATNATKEVTVAATNATVGQIGVVSVSATTVFVEVAATGAVSAEVATGAVSANVEAAVSAEEMTILATANRKKVCFPNV